MKPSLTETLCTRCGLCCDGSLFADVELASGDEASALEVMGLEIEDADGDEGGLLVQPCGGLKGRRCSIYRHRPDCCRTFACRLLQEVKRGAVGVEQAKEKIAEALMRIERVKELVVQLGLGDERRGASGSGDVSWRLRTGCTGSVQLASIGGCRCWTSRLPLAIEVIEAPSGSRRRAEHVGSMQEAVYLPVM